MFRLYWIQTLKLQLFPVTDHLGYRGGIGLCQSVVCHSQKKYLLLQFCTLYTPGAGTFTFCPSSSTKLSIISMYLLFE